MKDITLKHCKMFQRDAAYYYSESMYLTEHGYVIHASGMQRTAAQNAKQAMHRLLYLIHDRHPDYTGGDT